MLSNKVYRNMQCLNAWQEIPRGAVVAIVENVRNRILNFVLDIWKEAPDAGENLPDVQKVSNKRVNQIFNIEIMGNVANLASGSNSITQTAYSGLVPGDFDALRAHLLSHGIGKIDIDELEVAVKDDKPGTGSSWGKKVSSWIGKMLGKAGTQAWDVSKVVAGEVLSKALAAYLWSGMNDPTVDRRKFLAHRDAHRIMGLEYSTGAE